MGRLVPICNIVLRGRGEVQDAPRLPGGHPVGPALGLFDVRSVL